MSWITSFHRHLPICLLGASPLVFASCALVLDDKPQDSSAYTWDYEHWDSFPDSEAYEFMQCQAPAQASQLCGLRPNASQRDTSYRWSANCRGGDCASVSVFAHYTLPDNIGSHQTLVVEAFDNARFQGSPVATLQMYGFDATHPNSSEREDMFLAPGEYYFRAYLSAAEQQPIPYPMGDMELIGDKPVGVYGALSGAKRVVIRSHEQPETIHISIDQLFKKPGSELASLGHLRLKMQVEPKSYAIPSYRQVHILLLKRADIESKPEFSFQMSSQQLLIPGQEFQAEFVTPGVAAGQYYVFAYLDSDGNGYFDAGEPAGIVKERDQPTPISLENEHTRTLYLVLRSNLAS